ncbi:MAG: hypothetical protein Q7W13_07885 [Bacteroidia bacterium]|nr:hypothetical protein [Bacteroidia bacterium]
MRNNFGSGNGHAKSSEALYNNITEAMNETLKKQMEVSAKMYNQLIAVPFSNEKTAFSDDFLTAKFFKSNSDLFEKNMEMYSDLTKRMTSFFTGSFYKEKEINNYSDKIFEMVTENYEKQIYKMKELNNYFFEALEKNTKGTSFDYSHMIELLNNSMKANLDSSLDTFKSILKPNNKKMWEEINTQMDATLKSNLTLWSDLMGAMSKVSKKESKETHEKTAKETKKETVTNHKK